MLLRTISIAIFLILPFAASDTFAQRGKKAADIAAARTITVITEPDAMVWLDGVVWGTTDDAGKLVLKQVSAGRHMLRLRADGYAEVGQTLLPAQKGEIRIKLKKTNDQAELAYQNAEKTALTDKAKAVEFYRAAIKARPAYPEAFVGLARVLADLDDAEEAQLAISAARKIRPVFPEASAVEGRIFRSEGDDDNAVAAFKRAIREGKGFQPEAYTGLALLYKEKAESAGNSGDFVGEEENYEESVKYFAPAVKQLGGAPDAILIYQFYGLVFEKMGRNQDAIRVYEDFLRIFPDTSEAAAVRSFIVQLNKQP